MVRFLGGRINGTLTLLGLFRNLRDIITFLKVETIGLFRNM
jgi:hypothetical protein